MAAIALRPDSVRANPEPTPIAAIRDISRPAPIVPPGRQSLAARAVPSLYRRLILAIEPWYDWQPIFIERMEAAGEGPGYCVSLQWLGISLTLFFGRTPPIGGR